MYADKDKKRAMQREWHRKKRERDKEWHEADKARKKVNNRKFRASAEGTRQRAEVNERNWRFAEWEHEHRSQREKEIRKELKVTAISHFKNPVFIFSYKGLKRREQLFEPLPTWEKRESPCLAEVEPKGV